MFLLVCFHTVRAPASQNKPSSARAKRSGRGEGAEAGGGDASPKTTPEKINRFALALTLGLVDVGRVNTPGRGRGRQTEDHSVRRTGSCTMSQSCTRAVVFCFFSFFLLKTTSTTAEILEQEVQLPRGVFPLTTPHLSVSFRPVSSLQKRTPELIGPACGAVAPRGCRGASPAGRNTVLPARVSRAWRKCVW